MDLSSYGLEEEVETFLNEQTDFIIDRVSQEGGNCDMFFGYHKIFDRRIALKVYDGNDKNNSDYEPKILSKLDHPNILKVRDAKRIGNYHSYFMTDEISGGDLEKFYLKGGLELKDKLNVIHGILNGLTKLHSEDISIVHRDLKPKNILIYDETKQPLISDFGSVKFFDINTGSVTGSKTTLVYTSKEVFDENKYTKQSDLYQVGIILFQILGGYFPSTYVDWLTDNQKNKLLNIKGYYEQTIYIEKVIQKLVTKNTLLRFDSLPQYIGKSIVQVIQKATHPNLNIRYSNTGVFLSDLFKVQKRLTNWNFDGEIYYATTYTGSQFRVVHDKKGYSTEKCGNGGWRRSKSHTANIIEHFTDINNK
jgi:eukaryotic-like serine/threonine-protein kinase